MAVTLRPYQTAAVTELRAQRAAGRRRLLYVLPTGGGKTTVALELVRAAIAKGSRVIFLAHRLELVVQAWKRFRDGGIEAGVIKAGWRSMMHLRVQVASIDTAVKRELPPADVVIIDEAHRALAGQYGKIMAAYPNATVIGLTATPVRLDGRGLGDAFEAMVETASVQELIEAGVLLRPRVFAPAEPDLTGVPTVRGDYHGLKLASAVDKPMLVGDIVKTWGRLARGLRTVVFGASVDHARHLCEAFKACGVIAEHVDGETPEAERAAILARLEAGDTTVVTNFGVLTEGWDCPPVACCILARPTKSLGLYLQMVGRVMRTAPDKPGAIVLDHAGCALRHGLPSTVRPWTLEASPPKEAKPSLRTCLACYAIAESHEPACPECRAPWPAPVARAASEVRSKGGELEELTDDQASARKQPLKTRSAWKKAFPQAAGKDAPRAAQVALLSALNAYATKRAYREGWSLWMFREVAGRYPDGTVRAIAVQEVIA